MSDSSYNVRQPEKPEPPKKNRDAWFIGYTPELLACVFIGCDRNERVLPGAANRIAAPIWANFITAALQDRPPQEFSVPENIRLVTVCQTSGEVATASCPRKTEYYLAGTEPKAYCSQHRYMQVRICRRSGLLPGPNCTRFDTHVYPLGEMPTVICDQCKPGTGFFNLLRRIFRRRQD